MNIHNSISNSEPITKAMKPTNRFNKLSHLVLALGALALSPTSSDASVAYGSINNFDTVNDTGEETHGFEIEVEDCNSTDVTYTFDYNHYGTAHITQMCARKKSDTVVTASERFNAWRIAGP